MTVIAVSMVKDEADIVEHTVRRMLRQVDHVIVADNGSTDGTLDILTRLGVEVIHDREPAYYQSRKMTALADRARAAGATWVIPFDADEVWLPARSRGGGLADLLDGLPASVLIAEAPLFDHVATGYDDPDDVDPVSRIQWRRAAVAPLRKVACRAVPGLTIHQGNHSASIDRVPYPPSVTNALQVRHFPYRSAEQMARKARNGAAAYAATDLPEDAGAHWRGYGRILAEHGEDAIADVFHRWFYRAEPDRPITIDGDRQPPLILDPCP